MKSADTIDQLPPHDAMAERGVLGCILHAPAALARCEERFGGDDAAFYVHQLRMVYQAMRAVRERGAALDLITLQSELASRRQLDEVGGYQFLDDLLDATSSALNLEHYLGIVRDKFLARLIIQQNGEMMRQVQALGGVTEPVLARLEEQRKVLEVELARGASSPKYLKAAGDFAELVWNTFFGAVSQEDPGWTLPIEFKLKLRPKEWTLVSGDDGSGKSTFLNYTSLFVAQQMAPGERVLIASFEEPPEDQLRGLVVQLTGSRDFPDSEAGQARFRRAMAWLNRRIQFYAFLGIGDWRDVLDSFRYAAKHLNVKLFILDSAMRIGIQDDDYATQGLVAALFGQFAIEYGVHVMVVIHENKGGEKGKSRVRGSKLWTANASNVVRIERNMEKGEKLDDYWADLKAEAAQAKPNEKDIAEYKKCIAQWEAKWDSHAVLLKQRRKGTQQNSSKFFYYDWRCFQFREHRQDTAVNWLDRWTRRESDNDQAEP